MAIRQVLLNGTGSSGNGTTWLDDSSGTAAYIGVAGLASAVNTSTVGDTIYVKGTVSTTTALTCVGADYNYQRILGCKSTTTNNQGSIVTSDLIDGLRNGGAATHAYLDPDVPTITITGGASDVNLSGGYWYGIKFISEDDILLSKDIASSQVFEECYFEVTGAGDRIMWGFGTSSTLITKNCYMKMATGAGTYIATAWSEHYGLTVETAGTSAVFNNNTQVHTGYNLFESCNLAAGAETTIFNLGASNPGLMRFNNCLLPASWVFTTGTIFHDYKIESYGSDSTTGLTSGGSEQQIYLQSQAGTVSTETTKVRTGGADDGAAGVVSWDMSTFAARTVIETCGVETPWMYIWVAGDGTSKTLTVYFTSDSTNTRGTDWNDDEVWLEVQAGDDAGTSKYDYTSTVGNLLAAGSAVTDDTGSTWGAGTQNDQKLTASIAPDYEGYVKCRVVFAPGANAETIYVDPLPTVA